jgi:YHS domain-containing protein
MMMGATHNTAEDLSATVVDPVCGMDVRPGEVELFSDHEGKRYWFCAEGCRRAFESDPEKYLNRKPAKKKGRFGRFLDRIAKINEKEHGGCGPKCH